MIRCIIAVVVGALFYSAATAIDLVLAPGEDNLAILFAPIGGVIFTAIVVTFLLLPLRAVLRRFLPVATRRSHALIATAFLCALVTVLTFAGSQTTFTGGRLSFWATWTCYSLSITASFFWPLAARGKAAGG